MGHLHSSHSQYMVSLFAFINSSLSQSQPSTGQHKSTCGKVLKSKTSGPVFEEHFRQEQAVPTIFKDAFGHHSHPVGKLEVTIGQTVCQYFCLSSR